MAQLSSHEDESESDTSSSSSDDEDVELDHDQGFGMYAQVKSYAREIDDITTRIGQVERLANSGKDDWDSEAAALVTHLHDPLHEMILSWYNWIQPGSEKWDPVHNPSHTLKSEVADVSRAMSKIRALEARLKNFDMNSGKTNEDWKLLNSLKREVGLPMEFSK